MEKIKVPETLWYEDREGNVVPEEQSDRLTSKNEAIYQHTRSVAMRHNVLGSVSQKDVDACSHESVRATGGWIDGVEGRECRGCKGTQVRHLPEPWPEKWEGGGCYDVVTMNSSWLDQLVTAMVLSGDYTARGAALIAATCCERCMNVLLNWYEEDNDPDSEYFDAGYQLGSDEEVMCGTSCILCDQVTEMCQNLAIPCKGNHEFVEVMMDEPGEPLYVCKDCDCYGVLLDDLVKKRHTDAGGDPLPDIVSETFFKYKVRGRPDKYPPTENGVSDVGPTCCGKCNCDTPSTSDEGPN